MVLHYRLSALMFVVGVVSLASAQGVSTRSIVETNEGAAVVIFGYKGADKIEVQGSGCVVDVRGYIISTAHQVIGAEDFRARFKDGTEVNLSVVEANKKLDVALLKAESPLPLAAALGDANTLEDGEDLVAITAPKGLQFTVSKGIVSSKVRQLGGVPLVQTDLPLSPGSSGGPVFDSAGKLVGVVAASVTDATGVTLITPINSAYPILKNAGIAVPGAEPRAGEEQEMAIIPLNDVKPNERRALDAFNLGVQSEAPDTKIAFYQKAVESLPSFYEAWFNLAVARMKAKQFDAAVAAYEQAKKLRPEAPEVHRNLGRVYLAQNRLDDVLQCFQEAVKLAPTNSAAHSDLGEVYRRMKQYDKAESSFKQALTLKPDYADAMYNLGLTYAEMGKKQDAVNSFTAYLSAKPDASDAEDVRSLIRELGKKQ